MSVYHVTVVICIHEYSDVTNFENELSKRFVITLGAMMEAESNHSEHLTHFIYYRKIM
jgi:hypothetical protein